MYPVKQSTALTVPIFAHDTNGDGVTGIADGDWTKRISKNGGAFGAMTVTITEMENGWYSLPIGSGHSDTLGVLTMSFNAAASRRVNLQFRVHANLPDDLATASALATVQSDTDDIQTRLPAALSSNGNIKADLHEIDGQLTSGNNATLNLKQLNIVNSAGDAIIASSTGSNGNGINTSGNGSGIGLKATGGATGAGIDSTGGVTAGSGLKVSGNGGGAGIQATGGTGGAGINAAGNGSGAGFDVNAGVTGNGIRIRGGATSGNGINVTTTSGHGMNLAPVGTDKHGLFTTGGDGGASDGIKAVAGTGGVPIRGDVTGNITGNLSGTIGGLTAAALKDFFDTDSGTTYGAAVAGSVVKEIADNAGGSALTEAGIAAAVWDLDATGHQTQGTFGHTIGDQAADTDSIWSLANTNLDAAVSSRSTYAGGPVASVSGNVDGNVTGTIGGLTAAAIKDFFDTDSGTNYAAAVAGSVVKETADNAGGSSLTVNDIVNGILAGIIEGTLTLQEAQRLQLAAAAGKLSGAATATITIKDTTDTKSRIIATVDADGNRTAVTYDVS